MTGCLITPEYLELQKQLHATGLYGVNGHRRVSDVMQLAVQSDARTILDYGSGPGKLRRNITLPVREYDPCIPGKDHPPEPADLVVCCDVLEHVEPECLDNVLRHLKSLTQSICFVVVHLTPAKKVLADGRNAHLIQESPDWWANKLADHFLILSRNEAEKEAAFVLTHKEQHEN